jgi:hypothetical protein
MSHVVAEGVVKHAVAVAVAAAAAAAKTSNASHDQRSNTHTDLWVCVSHVVAEAVVKHVPSRVPQLLKF